MLVSPHSCSLACAFVQQAAPAPLHFDSPSFLHLQNSWSALGTAWQTGGLALLSTEVILRRRGLAQSARALGEMPWMHLWVGVGGAADEVWNRTGPSFCSRTSRRPGRAVLRLPEDPEAYLRGRSRQAVRTNITKARRLGITCRAIEDPAAKRAALEDHLASRNEPGYTIADFERDYELRVERPDVHVAERDGRVEAMAFSYSAGEAAYLIYLRTGTPSLTSSPARYALSAHVNQALIRRGVRAVLSGSALGVDEGTAYLQQRLGYIAGNVVLHRQPWRLHAPAVARTDVARRREPTPAFS